MLAKLRFGASAVCVAVSLVLCLASSAVGGTLELGPEQIVQARGGDLFVWGYSVPSYVDWNNDTLKDLVVGEGGAGHSGKVRVYLNTGTAAAPAFGGFSYVQSNGLDLVCPALGCLGAFPRVVDWNGNGKKDLIIGQADGTVKVFFNVGADTDPTFDGGRLLEVGPPGSKAPIDVGDRATLDIVDWNEDGFSDLVMGALDGRIRVFLNEGTEGPPSFFIGLVVPSGAGPGDLFVPSGRSSPVVVDLDDDGRKDLLTGNTNGQLLLYSNQGTDAAPVFSSYGYVTADGVAIDLPYTPRSRPSVCDWTDDGLPDVLIGAQDGKVHLYQGVPEPATLLLLLAAAPLALRRKKRT